MKGSDEMKKVLFVGGSFDKDGGRQSSLISKMSLAMLNGNGIDLDLINGGYVETLHDKILPSVTKYDIVLWFANVPNEEDKIRDVKSINPKTILITSKRNDNEKYTFAELISRALSIKANLTVEFSKRGDVFNMMVFDPLGNVFYDGTDIEKAGLSLIKRAVRLTEFTRVPSIVDEDKEIEYKEEKDFFDFAHNCAEIFHNLIRPAKSTERFLGNMSFRCQNGFPSYRGNNGLIYVSKRNVDKSDIVAESFVPTYLDEKNQVRYLGENKPSVDTPVQLRLYNLFPWANYMLHAHCFVNVDKNIENTISYTTKQPVPCGAIEEVNEILEAVGDLGKLNKNHPKLLAINLIGHGCILVAENVEVFSELKKYKNNCFVERTMPEYFV